jgi:hypothetical protein
MGYRKPEGCHPEEPKAVPSLCSGQALSETKGGSLHFAWFLTNTGILRFACAQNDSWAGFSPTYWLAEGFEIGSREFWVALGRSKILQQKAIFGRIMK